VSPWISMYLSILLMIDLFLEKDFCWVSENIPGVAVIYRPFRAKIEIVPFTDFVFLNALS